MKKRIYVNGVDVTECQYQETSKGETYCYCIDARNCEGYITELITLCEEHPNCPFKDLSTTEKEKYHQYKKALEEIRNYCIKHYGLEDNLRAVGYLYDITDKANEVL